MLRDDEGTRREGNTYWPWIENYVAEDYTEAVTLGCGGFPCIFLSGVADPRVGLLEKYAVLQSPSRIEELVKIFIHATKVRAHLHISLNCKADDYRWRLGSGRCIPPNEA